MTIKPEHKWKIAPAAWLPIGFAVAAEATSNCLRAYGLGAHLDRFTIAIAGHPVSIAGAVLVLGGIAVSITQARAAWVALTPGPTRQRIIAALAAVLLLSISTLAMASHILEAQRAKMADEGGARGRYDRAKAAYDAAAAELATLGSPRPVQVIQAEVQATRINAAVWRRSSQCSDISRDDTREACAPILALYKERGAAARKAELEPEVARLRNELAALDRPEKVSASEGAVSGLWGWLMGIGVVFVATFGSVLFARPERRGPANDNAPAVARPAPPVASTVKPPAPRQQKAAASKRKAAKAVTAAHWALAFRRQHGRPPTIGELQTEFPGTARTTAWRICRAA